MPSQQDHATTGAPQGTTDIGTKAVEKIISAAIDSVPGTVVAGSTINKIAGRGYPRIDAYIEPRSRAVSVETDIAVSWPSPVRHIARKVRETIIAWVTNATGMRVARCDVRVATVSGTDGDRPWGRITVDAVEGHASAPVLGHPTASPLRARPVTAPAVRDIRPVAAPPGMEIRSVKTPSALEIRSVTVPPAMEVRSVTAPSPSEGRSVATPPRKVPRPTAAPHSGGVLQ